MNADFETIVEQPANDCTADEVISEGGISWREDGKFLQVCMGIGDGYKSVTYDVKGELHRSPSQSDGELIRSVSEAGCGYLSAPDVAWQLGSSTIIAGIGSLGVLFWEMNGLLHGELTLPAAPDAIQWSPPSSSHSILATTTGPSIRLYTRDNYKWYLKTELTVPGLL
jgi:hypothetical protein